MEVTSSIQKKLEKSLEFQNLLSENGQTKDCFHVLEPPKEQDYIKLKSLSKTTRVSKTQRNKKYVTVESLPITIKMTLKDKLNTCPKNIQTIKSSPTSDQESTLKDQDFEPSWTWHAKDKSTKLWLPTETDCADLLSNSSNGCFKEMESNSWFSMTHWVPLNNQSSQKTSLLSSTFSIAESMEKENTKKKQIKKQTRITTKKEQANKVRKVGLLPTPEQRKILLEWFGGYRHTYNWSLACIKKKPSEYKKCDFYWLRNRFINRENIPKSKHFLLNTPKAIRANAIKELAQAYKTNFSIRKKDPSHNFELSFKKRKDDQCISIDKEAFNKVDLSSGEMRIFPTFLQSKIKMNIKKNKLPEKINYECKILLDKLGKFTMVIVYYEAACESQTSCKEEWCSIDPGIRTLYTVYSPSPNIAYELGKNDYCRLYRLCLSLDNMISKLSKRKRKQRLLKAIKILRKRIKNLVKEVHCKVVHFLVKNFKNIVLPSFDVSKMVIKNNRKIINKSVRMMLTWSHYALKERLINKAKMSGVNVFIKTEEWTSKTCTNCMHVNYKLGGAKTYNCPCCAMVVDRDLNGARNIFLKNVDCL